MRVVGMSATKKKMMQAGSSSSSEKVASAHMTSPAGGNEVGNPVRPRRHRANDKGDFKTATLQIRISAGLKSEADRTLAALGMSLPEAVRVFLGRVVREQAIPFALEIPNPETAAGLRESMTADHERFSSAAELFHALGQGAVE